MRVIWTILPEPGMPIIVSNRRRVRGADADLTAIRLAHARSVPRPVE